MSGASTSQLIMLSNDYAIRVENLSKRYLVGHESDKGARYHSMRDTLVRKTITFARNIRDMAGGRHIVQGDEIEEFWALKDISFDVRRGDVLGIIGRNGAGKSTLLKILSRITEPTEGRVRVRGRVASLLEVGTGFHPELTGRENIRLNGAILGMTRSEIRTKFDEIVEFAEVEKFLDTPVKRYSSGMYVRLAFAVAAHLDPEILVVDEVLAVGDAEFQKKCLGRMGDVARDGRTVLFVSHNMHAVERLCRRVLHLERGRAMRMHENVREGILSYLHSDDDGRPPHVWINPGKECENDFFLPQRLAVASTAPDVDPEHPFPAGPPILVTISGLIKRADPTLNIGLALFTEDGELLFWSFTSDAPEANWPNMAVGNISLETIIPGHLLNEGNYHIELISDLRNRHWLIEPGTVAYVNFSIRGGTRWSATWNRSRPGILAPVLIWNSKPICTGASLGRISS